MRVIPDSRVRLAGRLCIAGFMLVLAACAGEQKPLPTLADPAEVAATLGIPPQEVIDATATARAPGRPATVITLAPTPDISLTPSFTATESPTPSITPNPIQLTETAVFRRRTEVAATLNAPSPATITPLPSDTATPTVTLTPSITPTPAPAIPDNPQPNAVIFTSNRDGTDDLWAMLLDGEPARSLLRRAGSDEYMGACDPQGEALMFDSNMGGDREIYITDYRGTAPRPLTDTPGENFNPVWSPRGDTVAFVSTRAGNSDIWLMDSGGGNVRQITLSIADDIFPNWSADGNVLLYSSNRDGNFDIFQFNVETFMESQITFTPDVDELYPVLSPDFAQIAYVAETTRGNPATGAVFVLDQASNARPVVSAAGRVEMPFWVSPTRLLVSADLNGGIQILVVDLVSARSVTLTELGSENRWPRYCFVEPSMFSQLPTPVATIQLATDIPFTTPIPTRLPGPYEAVSAPAEDWAISRETWTGDEFAFISPEGLPATTGFLVDNLLNLTWQDNAGRHVVTLALEAVNGEFTSTLIGYTVNDLPGPVREIEGLDEAVRLQILKNSLRPGLYYMDSVEFTNVNITLNFRVPIQAPQAPPGQYTVAEDSTPFGWLISTERWSATELALLAAAADFEASVSFVGGQIQYIWTSDEGEHILTMRVESQEFDLALTPVSYTVDGDAAEVDSLAALLYYLREGILLNSIPPGEFLLSQAAFNEGALELIFLVPPQQ
jgi:Tol biopolymer transport system component